MSSNSRALSIGLVAIAVAALVQPNTSAVAQANYPDKPIRVINAFAAGTASDVIPRLVLEKAGPIIGPGTSFVFENLPGAGGNTGTANGIRQEPDGYKIVATAVGPLSVNKVLFKNLGYDPETDLEPITPTAQLSNVVAVSNKSGFKTLKELIAFAQANPDKLTYSSVGPGSSQHLAGVLFEQLTGAKMRHLPYRVTGQLVTDLVTGEVPLSFQNITNVKEQFVGRNLNILAIGAKERHVALPDVPTAAEAGLPGLITSAWFAFVAPKGTPRPIVDKLNGAIVAALRDPAIKKKLNELGADPLPMSPDEFKRFISAEVVRWREVVTKGKIPQL
jgi:tripartite-type tricarboxylate transporter receptor subunit TctC